MCYSAYNMYRNFNWSVMSRDLFTEEMLVAQISIDGLVQERRNAIANALVLRLSCTNPSEC